MNLEVDSAGFHGGNLNDIILLKLDSARKKLWTRFYGGTDDDVPYSLGSTNDGGFIIAGESQSKDGDVHGGHGALDYWILRLNADGDTVWTKTLGGSSNEFAYSIQETFDHGFIVGGSTFSVNGDVVGNHGNYDYWTIKLIGNSLPLSFGNLMGYR